jgi:hypothetical protein
VTAVLLKQQLGQARQMVLALLLLRALAQGLKLRLSGFHPDGPTGHPWPPSPLPVR